MSPLDKIEKGLVTADWNLISEAYDALTGKKISAPNAASGSGTVEDSLLDVVKEVLGDRAYIVVPAETAEEEEEEQPEEEEDDEDLDELTAKVKEILAPDEVIEVPIKKAAKSKEDENEAWKGKSKLKLGLKKQEGKGYYGNHTVLISEADTDPEEVEVGLTQKVVKKNKRKEIKKFDVKCSECSKNFVSRIDPGNKPEQECDRCVKNKARELKG